MQLQRVRRLGSASQQSQLNTRDLAASDSHRPIRLYAADAAVPSPYGAIVSLLGSIPHLDLAPTLTAHVDELITGLIELMESRQYMYETMN